MAAPPCHPSSTLPMLMEELIEEILIRIPPDEPAHLVRAALVCKPWCRILSDPGFLHRYRGFHRRRRPPPLLGFFYNDWWQILREGHITCFKPVAAAFPCLLPAQDRRRDWWCVLDCRHGRVLLRDRLHENLIVWDPISDACQELPVQDDIHDCESNRFAMLCAVAGCDHHDCHGDDSFLVVYLGADEATDGIIFRALVYSSEARAWGAPVSSQFDGGCDFDIIHGRAALIGDKIYYLVTPGANIVQYDLVKSCILFFSSPSICSEASHNWPEIVGEDSVLTQNEDGLLGLASIGDDDSRLYLWSSRMANHGGKLVAEWVQERVIDLDKILPIDMNGDTAQVYVSGFAEGVGILFICSQVGTFTVELKSGKRETDNCVPGLHRLPLH